MGGLNVVKPEIIIRITDSKGIQIGRSVVLFGEVRCASGLWDNNIIFTCLEPKTIKDVEVWMYSPNELKEFAEKGQLVGLVNNND